MSASNPKLLTRRELAAVLQVSSETISRWVSAGKIPAAVRTGQIMRFDLDAVREALRVDKSA